MVEAEVVLIQAVVLVVLVEALLEWLEPVMLGEVEVLEVQIRVEAVVALDFIE